MSIKHVIDNISNRRGGKAVRLAIEPVPDQRAVNLRLSGDLQLHSPGQDKPGELLLALDDKTVQHISKLLLAATTEH
jgi:hypothetical protein